MKEKMDENQEIILKKKPIVLIVDDNPKNLQLLGNILKVKKCDIGVAQGGNMALQMARDINPDLVLLDIIMPDLNGLEVCKRLKSSPETKDIPIIFLTAKTETEDIARGFRLGAVDYVTKPFNSIELLARVTTQLELKKAWDMQKNLVEKLQTALDEVKQLSGLLPICCHCKKIRDDKGYWNQVEGYISTHSEAEFSHCICPECMKEHYPDIKEQPNAE